MSIVLVVADEPWVRNEVHAALTEPDYTLVDHTDPASVADTVASTDVDVVVVDLQVGSMGGMAVTRAVRGRAALDDTAPVPVVMLLDRSADAFLAKRAGAAAWIAKPLNAHGLRSAVATAMAMATPAGAE